VLPSPCCVRVAFSLVRQLNCERKTTHRFLRVALKSFLCEKVSLSHLKIIIKAEP
jgi:hypothetical protein